jgi:hypothetical protein
MPRVSYVRVLLSYYKETLNKRVGIKHVISNADLLLTSKSTRSSSGVWLLSFTLSQYTVAKYLKLKVKLHGYGGYEEYHLLGRTNRLLSLIRHGPH